MPVARTLNANLRRMSLEGMAFGLMVGVGETYVPAFALALGMGDATSGLITNWSLLAGATLQAFAPAGALGVRSLRRWSVLCAITQAAVFAPLVWIAWSGETNVVWLFVLNSIYWGAGLSLSPAWNAWVGQLVPSRLRRRYFGRRTSWIQLVVLAGLLLGGLVLQTGRGSSATQPFVFLFLVAGGARLVSAGLLLRQSEPRSSWGDEPRWRPTDFLRFVREHDDGRIVLYLVCAQLAVHVAAPYFTAFMLRSLQFGYLAYTVLLSASFVGKIVALPLLARLGPAVTSRRLLLFGALGIVPLPAFWIVCDSFIELLIVQFVAGTVWAAYELAVILLQMDMAPPALRRPVLAHLNFFNALAQFGGATLGALVLEGFGASRGAYASVFLISALARAGSVVLLRGLPGGDAPVSGVALRVIAVRPSLGAILRPIHASRRGERHWRRRARGRAHQSEGRPPDEISTT